METMPGIYKQLDAIKRNWKIIVIRIYARYGFTVQRVNFGSCKPVTANNAVPLW